MYGKIKLVWQLQFNSKKSITYLECEEVKAVISIGCCYNLLSEDCIEDTVVQCGFPMSEGVKSSGLVLGKSSHDLACQVFSNHLFC